MAISYVAGTNTLTLDGVNTYTLNDIYNEDVAQGWGVVTHVGEMYLFMCNMVVGGAGAATKLIDSDVGMQIGVTGTRKTFQTFAGSSFEMTKCLLKFWLPNVRLTSYGTWKFTDSSIVVDTINIALEMMGDQYHKRTEIKTHHWFNQHGTSSWYKCKVTTSGKFYYYTTGIVDDLRLEGDMSVFHNSPTLKNTTITGIIRIYTSGIHVTLINCVFNTLQFNNENNYLEDNWEFNITVTDKENNPLVALVELRDKYGNVKHNDFTGVDGKLPTTWEVLANRYDGISETKTEYNPFTLTITRAGYIVFETETTIDHIIDNSQIVLRKKRRRGILEC